VVKDGRSIATILVCFEEFFVSEGAIAPSAVSIADIDTQILTSAGRMVEKKGGIRSGWSFF